MSDELYERATGENDYWCGVCRRIHIDVCPDSNEFSEKVQESIYIDIVRGEIHMWCVECKNYVKRPTTTWFPTLFEFNEVADTHFRESHS